MSQSFHRYKDTAFLEYEKIEACGNCTADERTADGNPAVGPAAVTFAFNGKDGMGKTGRKVTGRVHGITCGCTKGHAKRHDDTGNGESAEAAHTLVRIAICSKSEDYKYQDCGCNELGEEVAPGIPYCRHGAESAQHCIGLVFCGLVVVLVENPYENGAKETAHHLCDDITGNKIPGEGAGKGKAKSHCGIEMRSGDGAGDKDAHHYGEAPCEGDDHPPGALGFGFIEGNCRTYAVAKKYEGKRADKFKNVLSHSLCVIY